MCKHYYYFVIFTYLRFVVQHPKVILFHISTAAFTIRVREDSKKSHNQRPRMICTVSFFLFVIALYGSVFYSISECRPYFYSAEDEPLSPHRPLTIIANNIAKITYLHINSSWRGQYTVN